jgi:hypothetical protein
MDRDTKERRLLAMLEATKLGYFWIGSTSQGRHMADRTVDLEEVLRLAIIGERSAKP